MCARAAATAARERHGDGRHGLLLDGDVRNLCGVRCGATAAAVMRAVRCERAARHTMQRALAPLHREAQLLVVVRALSGRRGVWVATIMRVQRHTVGCCDGCGVPGTASTPNPATPRFVPPCADCT